MVGIPHLLLAALVVTVPAPRPEGTQSFSGDYAISYLGLTVAQSTFNSTFDNDSFAVRGAMSSAGIGALFDSTEGSLSSSGRFDGDATQPIAFRVDYKEGKKSKMTSIRFNSGTVIKTENVPPLKKRRKNWVPLKQADLRSVVDPLSATLVRAGSLSEVCGRTIKVYDGEFRANLVLRHEETGTISVQGYEGETVTCGVSFKPVAGYRKGRSALEFLEKESEMHVSFAPLGTTGVYAPIHATVGTQIGTITIKARRFEATK